MGGEKTFWETEIETRKSKRSPAVEEGERDRGEQPLRSAKGVREGSKIKKGKRLYV